MEATYERPREKLQKKGVLALSNTELLQVIIGSGNAGMPVTKIARKVNKILRSTGVNVTLADLIAIKGLGVIKAGQIIAGLELAHRLNYIDNNREAGSIDVLADLYVDIRNAEKQTLLYAFYDGASRLIDDYSYPIESKENTVYIVRKIFGDALAQSAARVSIAIGGKHQLLQPSLFELNIARDAYAMASLLSIPIAACVLINGDGEYVMKEVGHGK